MLGYTAVSVVVVRDLPGKITSDGSDSFSSPVIPSERTGVYLPNDKIAY